MTSPPPMETGAPVRRACDQCHSKKTKCNGKYPCSRCESSDLVCSYLNPIRPKGPISKKLRPRPSGGEITSKAETPGLPPAPAAPPSPTSGQFSGYLVSEAEQPRHQVAEEIPEAAPTTTWSHDLSLRHLGQSDEMSEVSPLFTNLLDGLIRPQLGIFSARLYPMIPVFSLIEISARLQSPEWMASAEWLSLLLAMTALSLIHPLEEQERSLREARINQALILLDEACRLTARWSHGVGGSVEASLSSYCIFGALFEMGYADAALLRLREAVSIGQAMQLDKAAFYSLVDQAEAERRLRLFWILAVTERAFALQRRGQLAFERCTLLESEGRIISSESGSSAESLRHLTTIFAVIDQRLITCWTRKCRSPCQELSSHQLLSAMARLHGSVEDVFGNGQTLSALSEAQKADLLITWQWLRCCVWSLAEAHGMTHDHGPFQLSTRYVHDIVAVTSGICDRLTKNALEAHGTGFAEKLYDIASLAATHPVTVLQQSSTVFQYKERLERLGGYILRHPRSKEGAAAGLQARIAAI